MELEFPASPARLADLRHAVRAGLYGRVPEADLDDLLLALNEAATNAVLHGSGGGGPVEVAVRLSDGWAEMTVLDRGPRARDAGAGGDGDDWLDGPDAGPIGGRGLWLMGRLVDEVRLERVKGGTRVTLRRRIDRPRITDGTTV